MKKLAIIILLLAGCNKLQERNSPSDARGAVDPIGHTVTVGMGGIVSSKDISILIGPAIIKNQQGSISFYVQKAPPVVKKSAVLTCIIFNAKNQLVAGTGSNLPNAQTGGTAIFATPDVDLTGGKVTCTITE